MRRRALIVALAGAVALVAATAAFGLGKFKPARTLPQGDAWQVRIVDLNRDGKRDVVSGSNDTVGNDDYVAIRYGRGNGSFRPVRKLISGSGPFGVVVGDLNGDRRKDIVVANIDDQTIQVFLQKRNGTFRNAHTYTDTPYSYLLTLADINGDGKSDIVAGNFPGGSSTAVSVLLGKGDGSFRPRHDFPSSGDVFGIAAGRMNGDKRSDVVTIDGGGNPSVLLANPDGTLAAPKTVDIGDTGGSYQPAVGDFNRDGKNDVAVANYNTGKVSVLLGKGNGDLNDPIDSDAGDSATATKAVDINRDGKLDLLVGIYQAPYGMSVLLGKGNGHFKAPVHYDGSDNAHFVATGRLNAGKGLDAVVGDKGGLDVYLNKP